MAQSHWIYSLYLALGAANKSHHLRLTHEQALDRLSDLLPNIPRTLIADIVSGTGTVSDRYAPMLDTVNALIEAEAAESESTSLNSLLRQNLNASRERRIAERGRDFFDRKPEEETGDLAGDTAGDMNVTIRAARAERGRVPESMRRR